MNPDKDNQSVDSDENNQSVLSVSSQIQEILKDYNVKRLIVDYPKITPETIAMFYAQNNKDLFKTEELIQKKLGQAGPSENN